MPALYILLFYSYTFTLLSQYILSATYTLKPSESLHDGQTLTSQGGTFQLGFFSPFTSSNNRRYLGIWYKTVPVQTVVWVANRDSPLHDASGVLKINSIGNLVIVVNQIESVIWSSNSSSSVENLILELLKSGNLVLRDSRNGDLTSYLWQSFDYPSDTLLPGMKLGWNRKTGTKYLSSWKDANDPSPGDYTWAIEPGGGGYPESILRKGPNKYYRGGTWNGRTPEWKPNPHIKYEFINNVEETYFMYQNLNHSTILRLMLTQTSTGGFIQLLTWTNKTNSWILQLIIPRDHCDHYVICGAHSTCDVSNIEVCQCLKGFKPKSPQDWSQFDWSLGCERQVPINCSKGEGFKSYLGVKLPDTTNSWFNTSTSLEECRAKCLNNCSCMAYSSSDIREESGCVMWFTELIDMRMLSSPKHALYIRMAASELNSEANSGTKTHAKLIRSMASIAGVLAVGLGSYCIWKRGSLKGGTKRDDLESTLYEKKNDVDIPLFDLLAIRNATNNFSIENKLGGGGFGYVYKGILDGQEIAVKRLSKNSTQGISEFKNEVILISKLQHRNLVRILGYCIQGVERILMYEYMENNSLDSFIFDESKRRLLDWPKRFQIILGIARGLLYLHHDSRLRVVHRDLKASNILLDSEMVAKIADFGIARIFQGDQIEATTMKVVGTRGYMSPEYANHGRFSVKSDVFSFGVLVLEIISGKRNWGFSHPDHELNLVGHAWRLWSEDNAMQLVDESMSYSYFYEEISRCIQIGLLCVQKNTSSRPKMSSVVLMLSSESVVLPPPQYPGFYVEKSSSIEDYREFEPQNSNDASITSLEAR